MNFEKLSKFNAESSNNQTFKWNYFYENWDKLKLVFKNVSIDANDENKSIRTQLRTKRKLNIFFVAMVNSQKGKKFTKEDTIEVNELISLMTFDINELKKICSEKVINDLQSLFFVEKVK